MEALSGSQTDNQTSDNQTSGFRLQTTGGTLSF